MNADRREDGSGPRPRWKMRIEEKDGAFLLSLPETGRLLLLNAAAEVICRAVLDGCSYDAIVERVAARWPEIDEDLIRSDVDRCLLDLAREDVIDEASL